MEVQGEVFSELQNNAAGGRMDIEELKLAPGFFEDKILVIGEFLWWVPTWSMKARFLSRVILQSGIKIGARSL